MATTPGKYVLELTYQVELTINDPDAVDRYEQDDWKASFYTLDQEEMLAMLADMVGIQSRSIDSCDGWADLNPDAVTATWSRLVETDIVERP